MKKNFILLLLNLILLTAPLFSVIHETPHFREILKYVKPNSLVILDIDDTLLIPCQTLGTDAWFIYEFSKHLQQYEFTVALDKALAKWEAIRHLTDIKIVEEGTQEIIDHIQNRNIQVMALTTQGLALATRTVVQLKSLNIDLTKTAPSNEDHYFINTHGVLYRDGVLFTSGTPKGPALLKLFDILNMRPEHVVFINDKETHLKDVEASMEFKNIPFHGLRYSYSDSRVNCFDPMIAEIQWNCSSFGKILSDEEARALIPNFVH